MNTELSNYTLAGETTAVSLPRSRVAQDLIQTNRSFNKRRHLALFTAHSSRLLLGISFFVVLAIVHLAFGASPLVILTAFGAAVIAVMAVGTKPYSLGSWFTMVVFIQMFGFAWIYKTFVVTPLDDSLPMAEISMLWGFFIVVAALAASAVSQRFPAKPLLDRWYGDPEIWEMCGIILYVTGQTAIVLDAIINSDDDKTTGALGPFTVHATSGIFLIAAAAARRGKIINFKIIIILAIAVLETLLFNAKSRLVFAAAAAVIPMFSAPLPIAKKITIGVAGLGLFAFGNLFIFPAVMVLRSSDFREKPFDAKLAMVEQAIVEPGDYKEQRKMKGDIWYENTDFIPTDGSFLLRFGSLDYLAITLKYGEGGSYGMSPQAFAIECIKRALPGSFFGDKDFQQQADHMWYMLDHRMRYISNCTMGPWGSARLIFGDVPGYLLVAAEWVIAMLICTRVFGMDIRRPLPQFILLSELYLMLDADVANTTVYIIRQFWQDAAVIAIVGFAVTYWRTQTRLIAASHKDGKLF